MHMPRRHLENDSPVTLSKSGPFQTQPWSRCTLIRPTFFRREDKVAQLLVRRVEVVVDHDGVVHAGCLGVVHLATGLVEAFGEAFFVLGGPPAQTLLERLERGWSEEQESRVEVGVFDLFDALVAQSRVGLGWSSWLVEDGGIGRLKENEEWETGRFVD